MKLKRCESQDRGGCASALSTSPSTHPHPAQHLARGRHLGSHCPASGSGTRRSLPGGQGRGRNANPEMWRSDAMGNVAPGGRSVSPKAEGWGDREQASGALNAKLRRFHGRRASERRTPRKASGISFSETRQAVGLGQASE